MITREETTAFPEPKIFETSEVFTKGSVLLSKSDIEVKQRC